MHSKTQCVSQHMKQQFKQHFENKVYSEVIWRIAHQRVWYYFQSHCTSVTQTQISRIPTAHS